MKPISSDITVGSGLIVLLVVSLSILAHSKALPVRFPSGHLAGENSTTALNIFKTCDQAPALCLRKGSPGPQCCNRQCVDLRTSRFHCGKCGMKCQFSEICCGGKCVNPFTDNDHCGKCSKSCGLGDSCTYGMCAYAD